MASRRESLISRRGSLKSVKAAFDQGLADALGVGPEPLRTASDDDDGGEGPREPVVWDGGLTPGATPGLAVVGGHSFGSSAADGLATHGAPAGSVPPIPELESLTIGRPIRSGGGGGGSEIAVVAGLSPAESVRAAARGELDFVAGSSSTTTTAATAAAGQNPSSASLTDVGGPSSPSAMPLSAGLKPSAAAAVDSSPDETGEAAQSGANTSSTSPEAGKDVPLGHQGGEEGTSSSHAAASH